MINKSRKNTSQKLYEIGLIRVDFSETGQGDKNVLSSFVLFGIMHSFIIRPGSSVQKTYKVNFDFMLARKNQCSR